MPLGYMIIPAAGFFGKILPAPQIADGEAVAGPDSFHSSRQPDINCIGLKMHNAAHVMRGTCKEPY
jgi:hypothetical protein